MQFAANEVPAAIVQRRDNIDIFARRSGYLVEHYPTADLTMIFSADRAARYFKGSSDMAQRFMVEVEKKAGR
jgi:hypothetical protein